MLSFFPSLFFCCSSFFILRSSFFILRSFFFLFVLRSSFFVLCFSCSFPFFVLHSSFFVFVLCFPFSFFVLCLTCKQKKRAMRTLTHNIIDISFTMWYDLPIVFGTQYSRALKGHLMIPYDFTPEELRLYLSNNISAVRAEYQAIQRHAKEIADNKESLQRQLDASDVSIWGSMQGAANPLARLLSIADKLRQFDWSGTNVVVLTGRPRDKLELDPSLKRLYIPRTFDSVGLLSFLEKEQKKLTWPWGTQKKGEQVPVSKKKQEVLDDDLDPLPLP